MKYIITVNELEEKLNSKQPIVLIDVRYDLLNPKFGKRLYEKNHLPNAIFLDLKEDLSQDLGAHGGNHPLPNFEKLGETLGQHGIDHNTTVVVYGNISDLFAARAWWLLHYLGHERVYVLDGGYDAWVKAGHSVTVEIPVYPAKNFIPRLKNDKILAMEDVRDRPQNKLLIDARDRERYLGGNNPLQNKSGHIPGAKNYFWKDVLNESGEFQSITELKKYYQNLPREGEIILSCGSGVSACVHLLLLKELGYNQLEFYPGSFSDWITYSENKIETRDE